MISIKSILPAHIYNKYQNSTIARRLVQGSMWGLFGSASSRILMLLAMIVVARVLGKDKFGELGMVQSTLGMAGILAGAGLGATATRAVSQFWKIDSVRTGRVIGLLSISAVLMALCFGLVLILNSEYIANILLNAPHLKWPIVWGVILMFSNATRGVQAGFMAGFERFDLIAKLNVFEGVIAVVFIFILSVSYGVVGAVIGLSIGAASALIYGQYLLLKTAKDKKIEITIKDSFREISILGNHSLPVFLSSIINAPVLWYCMTIVASQPQGYSQIGIYNAAYQWHGPIIFIPMIVMSASLPALVQEWESRNIIQFKKIMSWVVISTGLVVLPTVILVSLISPWIMSAYGSDFTAGWPIMVMLLAAAPFHALANISSSSLQGMNKSWYVLYASIVWGVAMLVLSKFLIPQYGVTGLAIAFLGSYASQLICLAIFVRKMLYEHNNDWNLKL